MAAGEDAQADCIDVLVDGNAGDVVGSFAQPRIDDLGAGIAQRKRDDLGADVMTIEARLCDQDALAPEVQRAPAIA